MLEFLVFASFFAVFYAYFGYPLILLLFSKNKQVERENNSTSLSIIITVRNEKAIIKKKLEQTLALSYAGELDIIVASDASDDGTDDVVRSFTDAGVKLIRIDERGGKEKAQEAAVKQAKGEIALFTDAKIILNDNALNNVVSYFSDNSVGAVSSIDKVLVGEGESSGEGFYVRYEMWLRKLEMSFDTLVGLSGSCFAVRKSICDNWNSSIPSDFALLIRTRELGFRGVLAEDVIGSYFAVKTEEEEFSRKVRTVLRGITTFFTCKKVLNPFNYGLFSWQIVSHKLCRWLVPGFLIIALVGCILLHQQPIFSCLLCLMVAFYGLALLGYLVPALRSVVLIKIPLFFTVVNAAIFIAWCKYLSGQRSVAWSPSNKIN